MCFSILGGCCRFFFFFFFTLLNVTENEFRFLFLKKIAKDQTELLYSVFISRGFFVGLAYFPHLHLPFIRLLSGVFLFCFLIYSPLLPVLLHYKPVRHVSRPLHLNCETAKVLCLDTKGENRLFWSHRYADRRLPFALNSILNRRVF